MIRTLSPDASPLAGTGPHLTWGRALSTLGLLLYVLPGAAQTEDAVVELEEQPAAEEQAGLPRNAVVIPEIIVTATKQDRALRDIPSSIAVLDGATLEDSGAQGIEDFLQDVPGVNIISQDVGATKVTIRGISSDVGTTSTTGILYGNVSFSDAFFPFVSLDPHPFDMNTVEVLKGPQGTLFFCNKSIQYSVVLVENFSCRAASIVSLFSNLPFLFLFC